VNRSDLQELTRQRLREARILLRANTPAGAYYLAGYAVECALKACIARKTRRYDFPDKDSVNQSYTHELSALLRIAGLKQQLDDELKSRREFKINWTLVKDWNEESRYDPTTDMRKARDLYRAITNRHSGILPWVRRYW
jgi:HEPN domain-containing protein